MSKAAKRRNKDKRRSEKAKRKAANIARYASYIGTAQNRKKKGSNKSKGKLPGHPHNGYCGNVGCKKCFPTLNM